MCTDLFVCPIAGPANQSDRDDHADRSYHAVFVGTAENNAPYGGPTTIEADLALDRRRGEERARHLHHAGRAGGLPVRRTRQAPDDQLDQMDEGALPVERQRHSRRDVI